MKKELLQVLLDCIEFCGNKKAEAQIPYWEQYGGKDLPDELLWKADEDACAGCEMCCDNGKGERDCILRSLGWERPWDLFCKLYPYLKEDKHE